jgi:MoaA/NifB/PqqE/SkfB family radical SAM enzyme
MSKEDRIAFDPATGRVGGTPGQVFLELTSRCNLACLHCSTDFGREGQPHGRDMPREVLDVVWPWIRNAVAVNLNGVGEPLIAPQLRRVIGMCASGPRVSFNTNGLGLNDETCEFLVDSSVHQVAVSVDGIESNLVIRGVPYAAVRQCILNLARSKVRARSRYPDVGIAFTLMRRNFRELPKLVEDLVSAAGLAFVHVHPLVVFYEGLVGEDDLPRADVESVLRRSREHCAREGCQLVVMRTTFDLDERHFDPGLEGTRVGQYSPTLGCIDPFSQIMVQATGSVLACTAGLAPGLNVLETDLEAIWNGAWYRELRRRLHAKRFEAECEACPYVFGVPNPARTLRCGVHHSREDRLAV